LDKAEVVEAILKLAMKISSEQDARHLSHTVKRPKICRVFHILHWSRRTSWSYPNSRAISGDFGQNQFYGLMCTICELADLTNCKGPKSGLMNRGQNSPRRGYKKPYEDLYRQVGPIEVRENKNTWLKEVTKHMSRLFVSENS